VSPPPGPIPSPMILLPPYVFFGFNGELAFLFPPIRSLPSLFFFSRRLGCRKGSVLQHILSFVETPRPAASLFFFSNFIQSCLKGLNFTLFPFLSPTPNGLSETSQNPSSTQRSFLYPPVFWNFPLHPAAPTPTSFFMKPMRLDFCKVFLSEIGSYA